MNQFSNHLATWIADYYLLATLLLGVMLVARYVIQQPARRIAVAWGGVAALLLLATLVALPGWSVIHLVQHEEPAAPVVELAAAQPAVHATRTPSMPTWVSDAPQEPAPLSTLPAAPPNGEMAPVETITEVAAPPRDWPIASIVATTFGVGTMATAVWCLVGAWQLRRLVRRSSPAPAELAKLLALVDERQPVPRLRLGDELTAAVALGLTRPMILLPTGFARRHDREALRTALAHELAHIRNGDLWLVAALRLLMHLLWAHPGYWLVRRGVRLDQELLADAAAAEVTSRDSYAEQLVGWARQMPGVRGPALAGAVGLWETGSQLRQRIRLLLDERLMIVRSCSRGWKLAAMGLCAALGMALSLVTLEPRTSLAEQPAAPDAEVASAADYPHLKAFEVRVVDPLGNPIEGAKVTPWALRSSLGHGMWRTPDDNPKEAPTVVTGSNGVAKVPYPEYGGGIEESLTTSVTCRVIHPDFAEVSSEHIEVPGEATIELRRGAIVSLTGLADDEPVPPGELRALWSSYTFEGKASPDDEGHLVLPRLRAGPELIRLVRISESAPIVISRVIEVELLEGGEYFLIGELEPTVSVRGRLSDNVPRPVRNGWVVAEIVTLANGKEKEDLWWRTHATVAEDGSFELANLPAGEPLQLIAGCDGFAAANGPPPGFLPPDERRPSPLNQPQTFVLSEAVNEVTVEMEPTATFEVRVVASDGEPVEGVTVAAWPNVKWWGSGSQIYGEYRYDLIDVLKSGNRPDFSRELKMYQATTDASGVATITNVPVGGRPREHLEVFSSGKPAVSLGNPHGHEIAARQGETTRTTVTIDRSKLPATKEATQDGSTSYPAVEWPAKLSGQIKDDQDNPIAGAAVTLTLEQIHEYSIGRWDEQLSQLEGTTNEEGRYEFDLSTWPELRHRPFLITLSATAEGHSDGKTWTWYSASDNKVGAGFGKLTLPRGRRVTATVVDPDGKPVPGAVVNTIANYGNNMMHEPRATGEDGAFELMLARDGSAQVWIASEGWAPKYVAIAKSQSDLGKIELERGTALEGTVRDASGNPVVGCVVAMQSGYDGESPGYSVANKLATKTDSNGHYRLPPVRGGYKVYLAMAERSSDRVDNPFVVGDISPPLATPQWHELTGEKETKQADFNGTHPVEVGGTIRWRDGTPAAGVEVKASYLLDSSKASDFGTGIWIGRAVSDAEGRYTLKLPKGITDVTLSCFGARDKEKKWHSAFVADGVEGVRETEQFMDLQGITLDEGRDDLDWVLGEEEEKAR